MRNARAVRLGELAAIRSMQTRAAQLKVGQAAQSAAAARARQVEGERAARDAEVVWRAVLADPAKGPLAAGAWAPELIDLAHGLRGLERAVSDAEVLRERETAAWRSATSNERAAEQVHKSAQHEVRRRREEAQLCDLADRFLARRERA